MPTKPAADAADDGLNQVRAFMRASPAPVCGVRRLTETLAGKQRATFAGAVKSDIPAEAVARWVKSIGEHVAGDSIRRHRNGDCQCPRT